MKISTILKGVAAVALLTSFGAAQADHLPSPCATGEFGQGTNCMYLTTAGAAYNPADGHRSITISAGQSSLSVDVWMDFGTDAVQGGGFDVVYDGAGFSSSSFVWNTTDFPGNCPTSGNSGEQSLCGADNPGTAYEGIQFDDFSGSGYGGTTGTQDGFQLIGTLTLQLTGAVGTYLVSIAQPYTDGTFPNCFAPGAGSGGSGCVATNFYDLTVQTVPLPAAVWMMLAGLGSLAGFARRRA